MMRNQHIHAFLFLLIYLLPYNLISQPVSTLLNDVVLPPPQAAALGKYGDIPVNHFTGIPSIQIPIYTLQEGPLTLPISLSYHASGIKVAELASWVGLGWSLNAGGMISRSVLGLPDESTYGFLNTNELINGLDTDILTNIADGFLDSEPDIFTFNVGGFSGKFYFDNNDSCHFIPKQDLKLIFDRNIGQEEFHRFTLYTPDGTQYVFGNKIDTTNIEAIEKNNIFSCQGDEDPTNETATTWYLVQIVSADQKFQINLEYETEFYSYNYLGSCRYIYNIGQILNADCTIGTPGKSCSGCYDPDTDSYILTSNITGKRLKQITSSSGYVNVQFEATTAREDVDENLEAIGGISNSFALDSIVISNDTSCKKWVFSYDYFSNPESGPLLQRSENKRLKLTQIQEASCNEAIQIPPYEFTYNEPTNSFLPHRLSLNTDHWGFFNGASNEVNLQLINIPPTDILIADQANSTIEAVTIGRSNRDSDPESMKIGALIKIKYPTGGSTEFTFEANSAGQTNFVDTLDIFSLSDCHSVQFDNSSNNCCGSNQNDEGIYSFTQEEYNRGRYILKISYEYLEGTPECFPNPVDYLPEAAIKVFTQNDPNSSEVGYNTIDLIVDQNESLGEFSDLVELPLNTLIDSLSFNPDSTYKFVLETHNGTSSFELYTTIFYEDSIINIPVGGLRVAEIRNDPDPNVANDEVIKTFEYRRADGASGQSGKLFFRPFYAYTVEAYPMVSVITAFIDQSIVPLGTFEGYHLGYEYVVEKQEGVGFTEYTFDTNYPLDSLTYPIPPYPADVTLGKLQASAIFKEDGTEISTSLISNVPELYDTSEDPIFKVISIPVACQSSFEESDPLGLLRSIILFKQYAPRTAYYQIEQEEKMLDNVLTIKNYGYESSLHGFPTRISTTNSDGRIQEQRFKYPLDFQNSLSFGNGSSSNISDLVNLHMIGTPIETQSWEGPDENNLKMVGGQITLYKDFRNQEGIDDGDPKILKPYQIYLLESETGLGEGADAVNNSQNGNGLYQLLLPNQISSAYQLRASFDYEANFGNLVQQSLTDGTPVSFLWDSTGNRPIAQVVGQTYAEISSEAEILDPENLNLNELRISFPRALVTTYDYNDRLQLKSVTGPDGVTTTYDYDALGRLIHTTDDDQKLLQQVFYNYGNQ